jgi:hypothetical protein
MLLSFPYVELKSGFGKLFTFAYVPLLSWGSFMVKGDAIMSEKKPIAVFTRIEHVFMLQCCYLHVDDSV